MLDRRPLPVDGTVLTGQGPEARGAGPRPRSRRRASERAPSKPGPRLRPSSPPLRRCGGDRGGSAVAASPPPSPSRRSAPAAPGGDATPGGRRGPAAAEPSARRSRSSRPRGAVTGAGSPPETHLQGPWRCPPCGGRCPRSARARKVSDRRSRRLCAQRAWGQWGPMCVCVSGKRHLVPSSPANLPPTPH